MIAFSLFGIPIRIQPFFWLTLALIGGGFRADSRDAIFSVALFVLAGFVSILIHELGHALAGRKFGARPEIVLQAFGGYAAFPGGRFTRSQDFIVTLAGPVVQIVAGALIWLLVSQLPEDASPHGLYLLYVFVLVSFFWAVLNLLPVFPLDGGRLVNAILGPQRFHITLYVTIATAVIAGTLGYLRFGSVLLPIFMGIFAWQAVQMLKEHRGSGGRF